MDCACVSTGRNPARLLASLQATARPNVTGADADDHDHDVLVSDDGEAPNKDKKNVLRCFGFAIFYVGCSETKMQSSRWLMARG